MPLTHNGEKGVLVNKMFRPRVKSGKKVNGVTDKWAKTNEMLRDGGLRSFIPLTKRLTSRTLAAMLQAYRMVYVKPTYGSMGRGVMRAELLEGGGYAYQLGGKRKEFLSFEAFYRSIKTDTLGKNYLVQKGVHLLQYEGRPYDLRLVVQKSPAGGWEATGTVARVAHPGKVVTNGSQGGTILPVEQVLGPYLNHTQRIHLLSKLDRIGILTMKRLHRKFPQLNEIGMDIAIDKNLQPWILEVNTRPDHCPFAILQDQTMIRRIVYYGRQYGRYYKLNCFKAKSSL